MPGTARSITSMRAASMPAPASRNSCASKSIVFVDSITDLTRQAMVYAKQQPEAFSERTGKPDVRGAYGLLGREVIQALKHLQHAPGKTVIFVGVLEKVTDEFNVVTWQPQMEGSKAGRELPGIVDQVISLHLFARDAEGSYVLDERGDRAPAGLPRRQPLRPARQGPLRPPRHDRAARPRRAARQDQHASITAAGRDRRSLNLDHGEHMYDMNDAEPQMRPSATSFRTAPSPR